MRMTKIGITLGLLTLVATVVAGGAEKKAAKPRWTGTIKVTGKPSEAELQKMAKVSKEDAEKSALGAVKAKDADKKITEGGLEVENGYLIYSFDVKVKGKKGIQEIIVDAGSGKVLNQAHESDAAEAKEKPKKDSK